MNFQKITILLSLVICSFAVAAQNYAPVAYHGTQDDFRDFIDNEMQYPQKSFKDKVNGDVEVSFIVLPDGDISDIQIDKSVNPEMDAEAIRIAKKMIWEPATKYGKPIGSRHKIVIPFHFRKYDKACKKRGFAEPPDFGHSIDTSYKVFEPDQLDFPATAVFNEGMNLRLFITRNMHYPEMAFRQNISGNVVLRFIVETNGTSSHFVIEESLGGGCDQEAKRIAKMISWVPAVKDNMQVRSYMRMQITFQLPEEGEIDYFYNNQNSSF